MLNDKEFIRYSRQVSLPEIGLDGQVAIKQARVLVIGCGGLGCQVALQLAGAGVGHLVLVDDDQVALSNLHRQTSYRQSDIEQLKVHALSGHIHQLNPEVQCRTVDKRMSDQQLAIEVSMADIVVDGSDNFATRRQLNRHCLQQHKALVSAAVIGWGGYCTRFNFHWLASRGKQPCYQCLTGEPDDHQPENCQSLGVVGSVVAAIASMQSLMTLHLILGYEEPTDIAAQSSSWVHQFDGLTMQWQKFLLTTDTHCRVCRDKDEVVYANSI